MSTIFVELFHLPISFILYRRGGHHPVAALVMAILLFGGWVNITWLRTLDFLALEVSVTDTWLGLSYSSVAVGSFISLTYTVYLGYAAAAVHKWRRVQKEAKYVTKGGEFES
ncbi:hypothetical protein P152DRAFT_7129 [Eremomyces bilateralis CBS 781.70]|uniref:Uncharacterized protein n=1 Tax=Eremomyces bilateralis CBS 781.70 TaxID=1392243 RepID=A0A6G1GGM9_9PEZI|nr:uncharacterized protein P152DRAFT_7129 [Eremomyces bilateralis CBS 781.70]KAF1817061.1 hypothetical protein P152DRAFT_7129 [Eremomyces bilateralis CBS 781.70]